MTGCMRPDVYENADLLFRQAARRLTELSRQAIRSSGRFTLALAGGSTPRGLYERLAEPERPGQIDWDRTHLFWGDERCVPPDHSESNYRMARELFIDHVPVPPRNIHRIRGEMDPQKAAAAYEQELKDFFFPGPETPAALPQFDLILLGMGDDGHTASLFPGAAALHEEKRWVAACRVEKIRGWRVTLTPRVINAAGNILFIVTGREKARCLKEVLQGPFRPDELPAQSIRPVHGRVVWMVDAEAASLL